MSSFVELVAAAEARAQSSAATSFTELVAGGGRPHRSAGGAAAVSPGGPAVQLRSSFVELVRRCEGEAPQPSLTELVDGGATMRGPGASGVAVRWSGWRRRERCAACGRLRR